MYKTYKKEILLKVSSQLFGVFHFLLLIMEVPKAV